MYSGDENGAVWGASKWFSAEWTDIVPAAAAIFCSSQNKEITNLKASEDLTESSPKQTVLL